MARDVKRHRTFAPALLNDGCNVRNLVAHGLAHDLGPVEAALAIRAGTLLILLTAERDAPPVHSALATCYRRGAPPLVGQHLCAAFLAARHELRR
ncbi:hypothetical protein AB0C19_17575 [Micromonospora sp. NPDC048842]|uniref:hypothetical protein n=1 Tax=Micromonospora sp. NPDC048842 TaxID=3154346 RepID=UPI0033D52676